MKTTNINLRPENTYIKVEHKSYHVPNTLAGGLPPMRVHRIAASVFFFIAGLTFSTWASRIPDIQAKLHLNDAGLGGVLFALPVGLMVSLPLSGWLVSVFGSKKMVLAGALFYPLLLIPLAIATSVLQITITLFFFGIASNLVNIAMNTQAVGVEKLYKRSVMASFHGLWSLAVFAGALTGTLFVSAGLPTVMHFSIVAAVACLLAMGTYNFSLPGEANEGGRAKLFTKPGKGIMLLGLIAFCSMLCEGAMADWSGVYFKKIVDAPRSLITLGYVAFSCTMAFGRFAGDWLVTKYGVKKMLQLSGILITLGLI
ncbi:MAG: MFS transporter, partial [Bacteroidota bacterium]|nr:MFS transporter [Bacteroidota bacterium]